jgi:hypothetical protein
VRFSQALINTPGDFALYFKGAMDLRFGRFLCPVLRNQVKLYNKKKFDYDEIKACGTKTLVFGVKAKVDICESLIALCGDKPII